MAVGGATTADRNIITVLAVDMVGSTRHIAACDPDEAQAFWTSGWITSVIPWSLSGDRLSTMQETVALPYLAGQPHMRIMRIVRALLPGTFRVSANRPDRGEILSIFASGFTPAWSACA